MAGVFRITIIQKDLYVCYYHFIVMIIITNLLRIFFVDDNDWVLYRCEYGAYPSRGAGTEKQRELPD